MDCLIDKRSADIFQPVYPMFSSSSGILGGNHVPFLVSTSAGLAVLQIDATLQY